MTKIIMVFGLVISLCMPVSAIEITAPEAPDAAKNYMPENTESFGDGLVELLQKAIINLRPDFAEAATLCLSLLAGVLMVSVLHTAGAASKTAELVGTLIVALLLINNTNSMIHLGSNTIREMSDYGKLLYPVMTAAMAAQGGITASAALYVGTSVFNAVLSSLISNLLLPMVYLYLALMVANHALGDTSLKKLGDLIKNASSWCLKTLLMIFTTYISITGVVSGTTDAAALKVTKVAISSVVPIVGGILSDASDAVLVSAGLVKNAAGIYGILAILALFLAPFLRIGIHYLLLKVAASVCSIFGTKSMTGLIEDFSSAMGLILAMTGAVCILLLISTVCFMKGMG